MRDVALFVIHRNRSRHSWINFYVNTMYDISDIYPIKRPFLISF